MTLREASIKLGIAQDHAYKQSRRGKLGTKVGNRWEVTEADLKRYEETIKGRPGRK